MESLDYKLSRVSQDFGVILDKALSEPHFRWQLINEPEKIIKIYRIVEENDIEVFKEIIGKINNFILDRAMEQKDFREINLKSEKKFNKTNPALKYEQALLKRHND